MLQVFLKLVIHWLKMWSIVGEGLEDWSDKERDEPDLRLGHTHSTPVAIHRYGDAQLFLGVSLRVELLQHTIYPLLVDKSASAMKGAKAAVV